MGTHSLIKKKDNIGYLINYEKGSGEYIAKNYELTIKDFVENEDVVSMASSWNLPVYGKALLGASHVYRNVYDGPQIYFTTDGYVVYVDTYVKYTKISRDEFIEKYSSMDDENWKGEFKDMSGDLLYYMINNC